MPLTEKVTFTATLQNRNNVQIPKLVRWRFKLESNQALKIGVNFLGLHKGWQFYYGKMHKDGRLTVPKLILALIEDEDTCLFGYPLEIMVEPA